MEVLAWLPVPNWVKGCGHWVYTYRECLYADRCRNLYLLKWSWGSIFQYLGAIRNKMPPVKFQRNLVSRTDPDPNIETRFRV